MSWDIDRVKVSALLKKNKQTNKEYDLKQQQSQGELSKYHRKQNLKD